MSQPYIGPERRKKEWRHRHWPWPRGIERRCAERRQEAQAGVIAGMSAEDMTTLAQLWKEYEQRCVARQEHSS